MRSATLYEIVEAARFELRRFGFRADGGSGQMTGRRQDQFLFLFDPEPGTGQMGFGVDCVSAAVRLAVPDEIRPEAGQDWHGVKVVCGSWGDSPGQRVRIALAYTHWTGGGNGIDRDYEATRRGAESAVTLTWTGR